MNTKNRLNWWIDVVLAPSALVAILTGIYFMFLPVSGYKGGTNPMYGLIILFDRHTWEWLHTWIGLAMVIAALIHLIVHWSWVTATTRRVASDFRNMAPRLRMIIAVDVLIAIGFVISAISGLVFFADKQLGLPVYGVLSSSLWDVIHTWSSILMTVAAVTHFALHWKWITNVTRRIFHLREKEKSSVPVKRSGVGRKFVGWGLLTVLMGVLVWGGVIRYQSMEGEIIPETMPSVENSPAQAVSAVVESLSTDSLVLRMADGTQVLLQRRGWTFAQEQGFTAKVGDVVQVTGFEESAGKFEISAIENMTTDEMIQLRGPDGEPLWRGGGSD